LANPDTPLDALAPQDEAWTHLLHLETQVQLTQASLTHHMTELSTLHQTTDHIFQSLQALLKHLTPHTAPPPVAEPSPAAPAVPAAALGVLAGPWAQLPCLALPDMYNGEHTSGKRFLQSCLTYIHLSGDAFDSDTLKIAVTTHYQLLGFSPGFGTPTLSKPPLQPDRYPANSLSSPRPSPPITTCQRHQPLPLAASPAITAMTATSVPVSAITPPIAATSALAPPVTPGLRQDPHHASRSRITAARPLHAMPRSCFLLTAPPPHVSAFPVQDLHTARHVSTSPHPMWPPGLTPSPGTATRHWNPGLSPGPYVLVYKS
ncbi:hypothetical protein C0993_011482, partial [Termitomyces sp. T159_Od127]